MKQLFTGNHHSRALLKTACVESHPITRVDSACVDPYHSIATIGSGILTQESSWAHRLISRLRRSWLTRDNTLLPVSLERDESEQAEAGYEEPWFKALHVWRFEILACMVSLGSFLALIATAAAFSDRPLADWSLQFISINGVVAGLTVLVKGSLIVLITQSIGQAKWAWFSKQSTDGNGRVLSDLEMIDEVSRGPWGSAIWLFRHPLEINIVTIGATIVLLVSGIDVFSQQLVSIDLRSVADNSQKAHVPWASNTTALVDEHDWKTAFEEGIYSHAVGDLPTTCPSGNCTWPTVPSVGVCGDCADVTHQLPESWITCAGLFCNYTLVATKDLTPGQHFDRWGYTLMNGPRPNSTWEWDTFYTPSMDYTADVPITIIANVPWTSDLPTGPTVDAYPEFDGDEQWTRFRRMVFSDFAIIDVPPTTPNQPSLPYSFGSPVVTTCSFWLCMQAISIKETSGRAEQTMISSKNLSYSNIYSIDSFNYGPNSGMSGTFSNVPGYNMEGRSFTANMTSLYQYPAVSSEARYVSFEVNADAAPLGVNKPALLDRWDYVKNDSQGWADRIAKSLTNKLRLANQCHPDDDIYAGEVWIQQAYIRVSWPWAAYPATLFAAAMALFTTTVVRMLRLRKHAAWHGIKWGNGTLAMLLCDVSDAIKRRARGSYRSTEALLDAVGDIPVCLEGDEEGWTFRTIS